MQYSLQQNVKEASNHSETVGKKWLKYLMSKLYSKLLHEVQLYDTVHYCIKFRFPIFVVFSSLILIFFIMWTLDYPDYLLQSHQVRISEVGLNSLYLAAFTGTFQGVVDVLCEWGSLFVITMENKVIKLLLKMHTHQLYMF